MLTQLQKQKRLEQLFYFIDGVKYRSRHDIVVALANVDEVKGRSWEDVDGVCPICLGKGVVTDWIYDKDSHNYEDTGSKKCECMLMALGEDYPGNDDR